MFVAGALARSDERGMGGNNVGKPGRGCGQIHGKAAAQRAVVVVRFGDFGAGRGDVAQIHPLQP